MTNVFAGMFEMDVFVLPLYIGFSLVGGETFWVVQQTIHTIPVTSIFKKVCAQRVKK